MNPPVRRVAPLVLVSLFAFSSVFAAGERLTYDPTKFSTGTFHGCPPTGQGSDPYLNSLKNRDMPPTTARLYRVAKFLDAAPKTLPKRKFHRDRWTAQQQDLAARWERGAVMIEGYLVFDAVKQSEEACNCGSTTYRDFHLWLGSSPSQTKASRAKAIVVEVSPRAWRTHPKWKDAKTFRDLIRANEKVRVAGWLMWDQEHAPASSHDANTCADHEADPRWPRAANQIAVLFRPSMLPEE